MPVSHADSVLCCRFFVSRVVMPYVIVGFFCLSRGECAVCCTLLVLCGDAVVRIFFCLVLCGGDVIVCFHFFPVADVFFQLSRLAMLSFPVVVFLPCLVW